MSFFILAKIIQPGMFLFFLALLIPGLIAYMIAFANAISPRKRLHELHNPYGEADHGHDHGHHEEHIIHHEAHITHHEEHTTHHEEHTTHDDDDHKTNDEEHKDHQ